MNLKPSMAKQNAVHNLIPEDRDLIPEGRDPGVFAGTG
jgi:hypothetical protein